MAQDTMFRNSVFQAQQAQRGAAATYQGLAGLGQNLVQSAGAVQDMVIRKQAAEMDAIEHESRLRKFNLDSQLLREDLSLRQLSAQTQQFELQAEEFRFQAEKRMQAERETEEGLLAQQKIGMIETNDGLFDHVRGRGLAPVDPESPRAKAFYALREAEVAKAEASASDIQASTFYKRATGASALANAADRGRSRASLGDPLKYSKDFGDWARTKIEDLQSAAAVEGTSEERKAQIAEEIATINSQVDKVNQQLFESIMARGGSASDVAAAGVSSPDAAEAISSMSQATQELVGRARPLMSPEEAAQLEQWIIDAAGLPDGEALLELKMLNFMSQRQMESR